MHRNSFLRSFANSLCLFKVVRETNNSNASSTEPIEIPPPRPKRKPSHPYPRKLVLPSKKENPLDQQAGASSPNFSVYEQENQSPTSVLPDLASDTASVDSTTPDGLTPDSPSSESSMPDGSQSPIPSDEAVNQAGLTPFEDSIPQDDVNASPSMSNDRASVKLELFLSMDAFDKPESVPTKVLKLFGKDVVVPNKLCDSSMCLTKSPSSDMGEELLQASPPDFHPVDINVQTGDNFWGRQTYYDSDESGNQVEKPVPLPWSVFVKGVALPTFECHVENDQQKESLRDGSCGSSSNESAENTWNAVTTQYHHCGLLLHSESGISMEPTEKKPALLGSKSAMEKASKGFVPYKRCFSERDMESSTVNIGENEAQRIRLC
ncbi:hypothetical protein RND81_09G209300 [Saponaria officinalis]|uniref:Uncharacterized protein n=1 Tax=Saponaria officinalis TaxID=3572 RepID=A0AAW1INQ3_SAPOF